MSESDHIYRSNDQRLPEYTRNVAECAVGVHFRPVSYCSVCENLCESRPFVVYDRNGAIVCDACADAFGTPALSVKKTYESTLGRVTGDYQVTQDIGFHWEVGVCNPEVKKISFHVRALIETLCERCAAFSLAEAYLVTLKDTPPLIKLISNYHQPKLINAAFESAEPEFLRILETSQNPGEHVEFFYLIDLLHHPCGLLPIRTDVDGPW